LRFLRTQTHVDATLARLSWAYIGDSENDAACFAAFRTTLGVANLSGRPTLRPRFVTPSARSAGFIEATEHLLRARAR
jgi:hydroxymethylpyrimidine pyrophosphatase-like HAD family hydrolase